MALTYESSDVYIEEQDLSGQPTPANTSIGAQVFASRRGPLGIRRVTAGETFTKKYGKADASISFGHYTALAFLAEASELLCNRVVGAGATYGGLVMQKRQSVPVDAIPVFRGFTIGDPAQIDFSTLGAAVTTFDNLFAIYCEGPGSYSSEIQVRVVSDNLTVPTNVVAADFSTVGVTIVGVSPVGSIQPGSYAYTVTAFNAVGETLASAVASVVVATTNTSNYITWDLVPGAAGYNIFGRTSGVDGILGTAGGGTNFFIDRGVSAPGAAVPPSTQTFTDKFKIEVYDTAISTGTPAEVFDCSFSEQVDGFGRQLELEAAVNPFSEYVRVKSNAVVFAPSPVPVMYTTAKIALSAGSSGAAVTASDIINGWDVFADPEKTDVRILINAGYSIPSVHLKMDSIAHTRGDCVAVLDLPSASQTFQAAVDYRNISLNLNSNRSALYGPDLLITDAANGKTLFVPPSGHVAGVYAKTDRVAFPWFAVAGLNRGTLNVEGVRYQYDRGMRDALKRAQVNYIRNFQGLGRAVWEQRTLQATQSGFSFLNVRRLFDYLALTFKRGMYAKEFEPNDDTLRREIRVSMERVLTAVQQARGVNQFLVICESKNNPPFVTAQGQLNVDVFIEPTLPAETIRIRMNLTDQEVNLTELANNVL